MMPPGERGMAVSEGVDVAGPDGLVDLTMFFPAYNEADGIERTVAAALEAGGDLVADGVIDTFEVIVVDDGSADETAALVESLAAAHREVRLVAHDTNRGLGRAIRTGFESAAGRVILYTDADLPFDLAEVDKALRIMRHYDADVVSAYRHDRTGEGPRRAVYSYVYNSAVHLLLGLRLRDVNFAGKLVRREVVEACPLTSDGSFVDVELLARAEAQGFSIVQFGVDYFPRSRGVSTLSSVPVIVEMTRTMIRLLPELRAARAATGRRR